MTPEKVCWIFTQMFKCLHVYKVFGEYLQLYLTCISWTCLSWGFRKSRSSRRLWRSDRGPGFYNASRMHSPSRTWKSRPRVSTLLCGVLKRTYSALFSRTFVRLNCQSNTNDMLCLLLFTDPLVILRILQLQSNIPVEDWMDEWKKWETKEDMIHLARPVYMVRDCGKKFEGKGQWSSNVKSAFGPLLNQKGLNRANSKSRAVTTFFFIKAMSKWKLPQYKFVAFNPRITTVLLLQLGWTRWNLR